LIGIRRRQKLGGAVRHSVVFNGVARVQALGVRGDGVTA